MELAHELALGRATLTLTALLDQQMDVIYNRFLVEAGEPPDLQRKRAGAANRIVIICRSLADEIRRYEQLTWLLHHPQDDDDDETIF